MVWFGEVQGGVTEGDCGYVQECGEMGVVWCGKCKGVVRGDCGSLVDNCKRWKEGGWKVLG